MDFTDTPQEAEYRAKVRAFLSANAEKKEPGKQFAKQYGEEGLVLSGDLFDFRATYDDMGAGR